MGQAGGEIVQASGFTWVYSFLRNRQVQGIRLICFIFLTMRHSLVLLYVVSAFLVPSGVPFLVPYLPRPSMFMAHETSSSNVQLASFVWPLFMGQGQERGESSGMHDSDDNDEAIELFNRACDSNGLVTKEDFLRVADVKEMLEEVRRWRRGGDMRLQGSTNVLCACAIRVCCTAR